MSEVKQTTQRISDRLIAYWNGLKGEGPIPFERDVDLGAIPDLLADSFMIEVENNSDGERQYRYSFVGESIVDASGDDFTGKDVYSHLISPCTQELLKKFKMVSQTLGPVSDDSEFVSVGGLLIRYRRCLVPLAFPSGDLGFILGVMKWRAYQVYAREDGKRFMSGRAICEDDFEGPPKPAEKGELEQDFSAIEGMDGEDDKWAEVVLDIINGQE